MCVCVCVCVCVYNYDYDSNVTLKAFPIYKIFTAHEMQNNVPMYFKYKIISDAG